jgi:protein tyrosine/serine phosphatase
MFKFIIIFSLLLVFSGCKKGIVDPGAVYRSQQLKSDELQTTINQLKIKTIINLRGENPDQDWFKNEKKIADENGVQLVNISMSAKRLPHRKDLLKLLDTFRDASRPILIHCKAGVDRTGEASALYQMIYMHYSKAEALDMLSLKWAHVEKIFPAKRYFIKSVWVDEEWARSYYFPCTSNYKYYDKNNSECRNTADKKILSSEEDDT